jgi:two-component system sensor histidine kinase VicK
MLKLNIRLKILVLIMAATIIPLIVLNLYWTQSQRQVLIKNTQTRQALVTTNDASDVTNFLDDKVRALIIHSQSITLEQANTADAENELKTLLFQDSDITRVALTNRAGQEVVAVAAGGAASPLQNDSNAPAFKVVDYYAGNQYVSPVSIGPNDIPTITIAVPIVGYTTPQNLANLSTSEPGLMRQADSISGAIIAQVKLQDLWSSVLSAANNIGGTTGSYAYVVDQNGNIIAYPNSKVVEASKNISKVPIISNFLSHISTNVTEGTDQGVSENGTAALATYQRIPITNWAIVVEDPLSSIYKTVNHVSYIGSAIALIAIVVMSLTSIWLSRFLSEPILRIAKAAERIGNGDLDTQIDERRNDEIGTLSESINAMGRNLKQSIDKINAQTRQLEAILNNTTDSILAVDQQGRIIIANDSAVKLFEAPSSALFGQNIETLLLLSDTTKSIKLDYDSMEPGVNLFRGLQYVSPSKVTHYIDIVAFKIVGSVETVVTQTIITIQDDTKNRELDNMKLDFVSMAAHELRTPLSAIQGYLELIELEKDTVAIPDKIQMYLGQARASSGELSTIIGNLLSVTHIEHSNRKSFMEKIDLAGIARESVKGLRFNAEAKKIKLAYDGPNGSCYVIGDHTSLKEVVNNLVDNAIKYTPEGGKVTIGFSQSATSYIVKVTDSGIGIPKNAMPYLFTKFYRVHGGLASGSSGTGLGLFIAKAIIEDDNHRGTITVASEEGKGTEFTITLPVFDEAHFNEIQKAQNEIATGGGGNHAWFTKNTSR